MQRSLHAVLLALAILGVARTAMSDLLTDSVVASDSSTLTDSFVDLRGQSSADCGCTNTLGLSNSPDLSARNNADCLTGLTESFVMVLGANPEFPDLYYGENGRLGWLALGIRPLEIRFEYIELEDLPYATNVFLDGTAVASIVFPPRYSLRPFAVIEEGRVYCGTISEDNVYLTTVPEPSVGISLLVGVGTLALLGMRRAKRSQAG